MYIPSSFFLTLATISSRPRLAHNSGKRKQQKEPEPVVVSEEEEEGDEEESVQDESVTRCVCGKQRKSFFLCLRKMSLMDSTYRQHWFDGMLRQL